MVVSVFVAMTGRLDILAGFLVEGFLTARRAEVIGFALVFGLASGGLGVNIHAANGVFFHKFSPLVANRLVVTNPVYAQGLSVNSAICRVPA
jgi:hypothetical protein